MKPLKHLAATLALCLVFAAPLVAVGAGASPKETPKETAQAPAVAAPAVADPVAVAPAPLQAAVQPLPLHMDKDLAREHEDFARFAQRQVERMNATIIGGKNSMQVHKGHDGLYRATYKAIDMPGLVCQVRRSESNPSFYVGNLIYTEQVLQSVGKNAEACRKGPFEPVSEKTSRLIYTSGRGGGWH